VAETGRELTFHQGLLPAHVSPSFHYAATPHHDFNFGNEFLARRKLHALINELK
jgi:hypothetical protein